MQTKIIQTTPTKEMKEEKIIQKTIVLQKEHMNSSITEEKRPDKGKDHSNKRKREDESNKTDYSSRKERKVEKSDKSHSTTRKTEGKEHSKRDDSSNRKIKNNPFYRKNIQRYRSSKK